MDHKFSFADGEPLKQMMLKGDPNSQRQTDVEYNGVDFNNTSIMTYNHPGVLRLVRIKSDIT